MAKKGLRIKLEVDLNTTDSLLFPQKPFTFTNTGTFREGDLAINRNGLSITQSPPNSPPIAPKGPAYSLQDFEVIKTIGQGSGGVVRKVRHIPTNHYAALKVVAMDITETIRKQIVTELKILYNCRSPHVVSLLDAFYTEGSIFIALEYMDGGSLADMLTTYASLPEPVLANITIQAVKGLTHLQERNIMHRDIKPSNILINTKGEVKIADFGVSSQLTNTGAQAVTWVGTVTYMSPERIQGQSYSYSADVWALGMTILECALGKYPYANVDSKTQQPIAFFELLGKVVQTPQPSLPPGQFSPEFCSFIATCLNKDHTSRPTPAELLKHPFIVKNSTKATELDKYVTPLDPEDGIWK